MALCEAAYDAPPAGSGRWCLSLPLDKPAYAGAVFALPARRDPRDRQPWHGNGHVNAIASGTISLLANNLSSGIEPVFSKVQQRRILGSDGRYHDYQLPDYAWQLWQSEHPGEPAPDTFVTVEALQPEHHLRMQAALQKHVDNAISKVGPARLSLRTVPRSLPGGPPVWDSRVAPPDRPSPVTGYILGSVSQARNPTVVHWRGKATENRRLCHLQDDVI